MSAVVNLRMARKRKARATKQDAAAENRARHGRTKAEKLGDRVSAEKSLAFIERHRLEPSGTKDKA